MSSIHGDPMTAGAAVAPPVAGAASARPPAERATPEGPMPERRKAPRPTADSPPADAAPASPASATSASATSASDRPAATRHRRPLGNMVMHAPQVLRALVRADEIWLVVLAAVRRLRRRRHGLADDRASPNSCTRSCS